MITTLIKKYWFKPILRTRKIDMRSSYTLKELDYGDILKSVCFLIKPKTIVEFGILDGFSLSHFIENSSPTCNIQAYDIFDDFVGNHATKNNLEEKFNMYSNVKIQYGNFYTSLDLFEDNSIDILHIDIANTGEIVPTVAQYMKKVSQNGVLILEGGSKERDEIEWMKKYQKLSLRTELQKMSNVSILTLGKVPSITLIQHKKE